MAIFKRSEFKSVALSKTNSYKNLRGFVSEARAQSKSNAITSIFLSHAHSDKDLIEEAVTFFKSLNINVYVDWMDETMPEKPNGITASKIKTKILNDDKFIFLATNAAVISKWCNWEVGIGDAYKLQNDKICLLPLADSNGHWTGNEYLQIYPRIESVAKDNFSFYDNIFRVIYPDGKTTWLSDWLKK
ncbi:toll/interleukin-1 receptor domain-containing protein [uncultured Flavobacterium sp.]|uniref:toll/interleukin-1 receptor domain-containing protein n=1 Tax=uncultured Flavobacterium sp. TaxID=165435 RepID=UPI00292F2EDA|nr:toll/interleukin-1 receptor domain-containing protein [uncultured Flavobacterium sp.]